MLYGHFSLYPFPSSASTLHRRPGNVFKRVTLLFCDLWVRAPKRSEPDFLQVKNECSTTVVRLSQQIFDLESSSVNIKDTKIARMRQIVFGRNSTAIFIVQFTLII